MLIHVACAPVVGGSGGAASSRPIAVAHDNRSVGVPARRIPSQPGTITYGPRAARELDARLPGDPVRLAVVSEIRRLARKARHSEPLDDARLDAAANDIACGLRGVELPPFETVAFLLGHYGLVEAAPNLLLVRASPGADQEVRDQIAGQIPAIMRSSRIDQVGVGVCRGSSEMAVVVALQEKNVDLDSVPRHLALGGAATVQGRLLAGHHRPEVIVTDPNGQTRELRAGGDASAVGFRVDLHCDRGAGRYQVEVTGEGPTGTAVLANFPVYCGTPAPIVPPTAEEPKREGPLGAREAELRMLEILNRDRRAAQLPPVAIDRKLGEVARAHSQDMADHDFVGHISPTTGNALDRVRRARLSPSLLLENVARAYSPEEAESGLMMSPGHRANILDPRITRVGIGIVIGRPVTGTSPLLVTQLFF